MCEPSSSSRCSLRPNCAHPCVPGPNEGPAVGSPVDKVGGPAFGLDLCVHRRHRVVRRGSHRDRLCRAGLDLCGGRRFCADNAGPTERPNGTVVSQEHPGRRTRPARLRASGRDRSATSHAIGHARVIEMPELATYPLHLRSVWAERGRRARCDRERRLQRGEDTAQVDRSAAGP